ncbi:hypothetical protein TNIN_409011, partial [Trichonephila inaurata madagascariensis]
MDKCSFVRRPQSTQMTVIHIPDVQMVEESGSETPLGILQGLLVDECCAQSGAIVL